MVFSSIFFLFLFLPVVLLVYHCLRERLRNSWLLLSSLVFYFWGENFLVWLLAASVLANYAAGLVIAGSVRGVPKQLEPGVPRSFVQKFTLVLAVCFNLGMLGLYKYFNFGVDNVASVLGAFGAEGGVLSDVGHVALPLGISFYTFQALSYSIDVYRGHVRATRNFIDFACYVTMFPQLVAGPIVRYCDIDGQLRNRQVTREGVASGVQRFILGLGKKVLLANTVGAVADQIFGLPGGELHCTIAWLGAVCYTLQIYFDFSGYSDMAIGLGLMFGFKFPENFNYPYVAQSVRDFWSRWHISLSTWFRDYLYIPLGGNRGSTATTYRNLMTVFLLCGLWHGASWTFVLWGAYQGAFLVLERVGLAELMNRWWRPLRHVYAMLVVLFGWVLFRAETLTGALVYMQAMLGFGGGAVQLHPLLRYLQTDVVLALAIGIVVSAPVLPAALEQFRRRWAARERGRPWSEVTWRAVGISCVFCLFFLCVMSIASGAHNPFLYFRF